MTPTFSIPPGELAKLNATLLKFSAEMKRDLKEVILSESRSLLKDAVNFTPPLAKGDNKFKGIAPKVQRIEAAKNIEREVMGDGKYPGAFRPFEEIIQRFTPKKTTTKKVNYAKVRADLRRYTQSGRLGAVKKILSDFHFHTDVVAKATEDSFTARRHGGKRRFVTVLDAKSIEPVAKRIVRKLVAKLGLGKSGWNQSARGLGMKMPKWIADKDGRGGFSSQTTEGGFSVVLLNAVKHIQKFAPQILGKAVARRQQSMESRMKHAMERATRRAK